MKKVSEKKQRQQLLLQHDQSFLDQGFQSLAGVDEAGMGPLAGPVVASAVIVRDFSFSCRVNDSKQMSSGAREIAFREIQEKCLVGISVIGHEVIDEINIYQAGLLAMKEAVEKLSRMPDCLLVDGPKMPKLALTQFPIIAGDAKSFSIACASIIAKVTRDRIMEEYDKEFPEYGFGKHKGYGTSIHLGALEKIGPCRIHRRSFEPVRLALDRR